MATPPLTPIRMSFVPSPSKSPVATAPSDLPVILRGKHRPAELRDMDHLCQQSGCADPRLDRAHVGTERRATSYLSTRPWYYFVLHLCTRSSRRAPSNYDNQPGLGRGRSLVHARPLPRTIESDSRRIGSAGVGHARRLAARSMGGVNIRANLRFAAERSEAIPRSPLWARRIGILARLRRRSAAAGVRLVRIDECVLMFLVRVSERSRRNM
jgi:hypothetical protein